MSDLPPPPAIDLDWARHRSWLRRLAASLVVDAAQAEDLTQQALLAALERPPADPTRQRPWLAAVTRNLARRFGTSETRRLDRERAVAAPERLPSAHDVVAEASLQHEISAALLELSEPDRTTLLLRFFKDLPPRAIAKQLGIPVETVRTRVNRGLERLRARLLARRGGTTREQALALLGLLAPEGRRAVQRALMAGTGPGSVAAGTLVTSGALGAITMSIQVKLAIAAVVLGAGTFAAMQLSEPAMRVPASTTSDARDTAAASAAANAAELPKPAEASRVPDDTRRDPPPESKPVAKDAPEGQWSVEGIVRSARGDPVAGAAVFLEIVSKVGAPAPVTIVDPLARHLSELLGPPAPGKKAFGRTKSAADGTFRFEGLHPAGIFDVAAMHPDEGLGVASNLSVDPKLTTMQIEVKLRGGAVLSGSVRDRTGAPIAAATIQGHFQFGEGRDCVGIPATVATSDGAGSYRSPPLPFARLLVECNAKGYVTATAVEELVVPAGAREHRLDFTLDRIRTVTGRIVRLDGTPANLGTTAQRLKLIGGEVDPLAAIGAPAMLGARGLIRGDEYEIASERGAIAFVSLWHENVLLGTASVVDPAAGPDLPIDLARLPQPPETVTVALSVVDELTGEPVSRFAISLFRDLPGELADVKQKQFQKLPGAEPIVRFEKCRPGDYEVEVYASGYASRVAVITITNAPASEATRIGMLRACSTLGGRVLGPGGAPLAGAEVCLLTPVGRNARPFPETLARADAEGRFAFRDLAEGDYVLVATAPGLAPATIAARSGLEDVALTLRDGVEVTVQPTREGRNVAYASCSLRVRDERGVPVLDEHQVGRWVVRAGRSGFPIRLAPGEYTVELLAAGHRGEPVRFTARAGAVVPVELRPISE